MRMIALSLYSALRKRATKPRGRCSSSPYQGLNVVNSQSVLLVVPLGMVKVATFSKGAIFSSHAILMFSIGLRQESTCICTNMFIQTPLTRTYSSLISFTKSFFSRWDWRHLLFFARFENKLCCSRFIAESRR